eukprot:jgi/Mesvir1/11187/Mv14578-RA.1
MSDRDLRAKIKPPLMQKGSAPEAEVDRFLSHITYLSGQYDDPNAYQELHKNLEEYERAAGNLPARRMYYLATPPDVYSAIARNVAEHVESDKATTKEGGWARLIIEKPFGRNTETAEQLNREISSRWPEERVYRIDHFLGKEVVQNELMMRFANRFIHALFSNQHIANVQITYKETAGIDERAGYFDGYGVIRDVMENHLIQVLALLAMETPVSLSSNDIHDEKAKVLRCVSEIKLEDVVLGQYVANAEAKKKGSGPGCKSYTEEPGVPPDSKTPTFGCICLYINNHRWEGVPWILKAGKGLDESSGTVRIQFRDVNGQLFPNKTGYRNELVMRMSPPEAIYMKTALKEPGYSNNIILGELDLTYRGRFKSAIPQPYERLILDALAGDRQHFVRIDELMAVWRAFTPLLHRIEREGTWPIPYKYGSKGPQEAFELLQRKGYVRSAAYEWSQEGPVTPPAAAVV